MNSLSPYLTFNGNCAEAMEFYKSCLGGELSISTFGEAPEEVSDEEKNLVMHSSLTSNGIVLMASDTSVKHGDVTFGSNITLNLNIEDLETAKNCYTKLVDGGTATMPMQETFWGGQFGMLTDKYGVHWMINCEQEKK